MDNPSSSQSAPASEPTLPERPASARLTTAAQATSQQTGQQQRPPMPQFQPCEITGVQPFRPSKPFSVAKLVLGCFNLVFAIIALGLSLGLVTMSSTFDSFIGVIIMAVTVRQQLSPPPHPLSNTKSVMIHTGFGYKQMRWLTQVTRRP